MNYESFLKTSLAKYQNAVFTKNEIQNVMAVFVGLLPKLEKAEFADGRSKILLQLEGTIPVEYKGKTYNTPICVWLFDNHPYQAPAVYVRPTSSMYIKQNKSVDKNGHVCTEYLKKWQYPNSDLMGCMYDLAVVFGHDPPLASVIPSYASGSKAEFIANLQLNNYTDAVKTKQDAIRIVKVYPDISANMQDFLLTNETRQPVLSLEGTIPVVFHGKIYNTPVSVHLMEQHPYQSPVVYVKPTSGMTLNVSRYVDKTGLVNTPYLAEWNYPNSDLLSMIQDVTVIFGKTPPLYTSSKTEQSFTSPGQPGSVSIVQPTSSGNVSENKPFSGQPRSVSIVQPTSSVNVSENNIRTDAANFNSGQVPGKEASGTDEHCLGSTEDFDIHCDPCNAESSFVEAEGFCLDCKEYYCKACMRYHRKITATRDHTILLKDKMPKP